MTIAFDNGTDIFSSGIVDLSHTVSGTSRIIFLGICFSGGGTPQATPTYAGVNMTLIGSQAVGGNNLYLYYLLSPTLGTNNLEVNGIGQGNFGMHGISYTGVKQSGQPDATTSSANGFNSNSYSLTTTTVADNCWITMLAMGASGSNNAMNAGTNFTTRATGNDTRGLMGDTNGVVHPAGSITMGVSTGGTAQNIGGISASFAPSLAAPANGAFLFNLI